MKNLVLILLVSQANIAAADDFGRLFFTPAQRIMLDNARKHNIRIDVGKENSNEVQSVPQNISLNGLVRRSDGKNTVWVNNRTVNEQQATGAGITTHKNDSGVKLTVPESGHTIDLKVGQTVEVVTGTVSEDYEKDSMPAVTPTSTHTVPANSGQADVRKASTTSSPSN